MINTKKFLANVTFMTVLCMIFSTIHPKSITVFSHGFNNHPERFKENHAIYAPCKTDLVTITFKHRLVCFGAQGRKVIKKTIEKNSLSDSVSFVSFSQGTTATIHYLANKEDCSNVQSILLIAPIADPADLVQNYSIFKYLFMPQWLNKKILSWNLPHYDPNIAAPIEKIEKIKNLPKTCPIIIMHGTNDHTSRWEQGYLLAKKFHELGYSVYFIEHDGGHNQPYYPENKVNMKLEFKKNQTKEEIRAIKEKYSKVEREDMAKIIHAIYKKHGLPHNKQTINNPEDYRFDKQKIGLEKKYQTQKNKDFFNRLCLTTIALTFGCACLFKKFKK